MIKPPPIDPNEWSVASFPSREQRAEFLNQVRLWNEIEGLPRIEALLLNHGIRVFFCTPSQIQQYVLRLVDAFGGSAKQGDKRCAVLPFTPRRPRRPSAD